MEINETTPGNYVELVDSTDMCVHYFERQQQKLPDQAFNLCVYLYFNRCPDEKKFRWIQYKINACGGTTVVWSINFGSLHKMHKMNK